MTRTWPVLLGLLLLAAPAAVQGQYTNTNADGSIYDYNTNADGGATIDGYSGPPWVVTIPTNINGLTVTSIGDRAFLGSHLTSVTIPGSVTSIGAEAFDNCTGLTNATISMGVTLIESNAFTDCFFLATVTIPGSATNIGDSAFYGSGLTTATIPNSVTSIGAWAFTFTGLNSVTIPDSVTSIGHDAFNGCGSLTNVIMANGVTSIAEATFYGCQRLGRVTIPGSVTNIGVYAFGFCISLASVYFTGHAPAADPSAFANTGLPTVYYLPGTTGWGAFSANTGLQVVLWNPLIQTGGASFGVRNNQFGFNITGTTNIPIVVEACTNLASPVWTPLLSLTLTNGLFYFSDPQWTNYAGRYYRISSP